MPGLNDDVKNAGNFCCEIILLPLNVTSPLADELIITFPLPDVIVVPPCPINEPLNTPSGKSVTTCADEETTFVLSKVLNTLPLTTPVPSKVLSTLPLTTPSPFTFRYLVS